MDGESVSLERRAARHGALADPARLAIVDRLTLGDQSPTELAAATGMASNLLAHHLRVLEDAGIVGRHRSEGDARRTYVTLLPGAFDGLLPVTRSSAARIVFVCSANSARSQLAAALWSAASALPVASAGTRPADAIAPGAIAAAARHGIRLLAARPLGLDDVLGPDDVIVTVCDNAHEELSTLPTLHWSIPDPVRVGTDDAFDAAVAELTRRVGDLAPRLTAA